MADDFRVEDSGAPFNMAIATLMGIREMFNRIAALQADPFLQRETKQRLILDLTRSIFEQSSCLLKPTVAQKYDATVDKLFESNIKQVVKVTSPGVSQMTNEVRSVYSVDMEKLSYQLRRDVLRELKIEGYVMPPKKDLSRAVGEM